MIEKGFVHLPNQAPWLAEYVHELTTLVRRAKAHGGSYIDAVIRGIGVRRILSFH
jgi:hypothetical protein